MKYLNENGLAYFWTKILKYISDRFGNVENTADIDKNVATAKKLSAEVTINGVGFDGSKNIDIPISLYIDSNPPSNTYAGEAWFELLD